MSKSPDETLFVSQAYLEVMMDKIADMVEDLARDMESGSLEAGNGETAYRTLVKALQRARTPKIALMRKVKKAKSLTDQERIGLMRKLIADNAFEITIKRVAGVLKESKDTLLTEISGPDALREMARAFREERTEGTH